MTACYNTSRDDSEDVRAQECHDDLGDVLAGGEDELGLEEGEVLGGLD